MGDAGRKGGDDEKCPDADGDLALEAWAWAACLGPAALALHARDVACAGAALGWVLSLAPPPASIEFGSCPLLWSRGAVAAVLSGQGPPGAPQDLASPSTSIGQPDLSLSNSIHHDIQLNLELHQAHAGASSFSVALAGSTARIPSHFLEETCNLPLISRASAMTRGQDAPTSNSAHRRTASEHRAQIF